MDGSIMISIPKLIHFIWLGDHPMHPLMTEWVATWERLHPGWEICLWGNRDGFRSEQNLLWCKFKAMNGHRLLRLKECHLDLVTRACHLSQRSNIWRYQIVQTYGGLYVDTDVEPILPIDTLLDGKSAFAATYLHEPGHHACSFFGAVPGHPWTRALVDRLPEQDPTVSLSMGSAYFSKITNEHPDIASLPVIAVLHDHNPWMQPAGVVPDVSSARRSFNPETYAIHHWSSNWFPKGFEPLAK
jgi:mannosyltransferase OCH1-like enzyme